jgi:hypothetical protein
MALFRKPLRVWDQVALTSERERLEAELSARLAAQEHAAEQTADSMQQSLESANAEIAALAADLERLAVNHQEQVASLAARSVHIHQRFSS